MNNLNNGNVLRRIMVVAAVATAVLWLGGCESDSVAPRDDLPTLTQADAAQQAGVIAAGIHRMGPQILRFDPGKAKELGVYTYDFATEPYVTGEVTLEFFTGGAGGTHVAYDAADYGMLYTLPGEMLDVVLTFEGDIDIGFQLTLDVHGPMDQVAGTAVIGGGGTFASDLWAGDFTFSGVGVTRAAGYPDDGTLTFTSGPWEMVVAFTGDRMAGISVGGSVLFEVDLDTGLVTPVS